MRSSEIFFETCLHKQIVSLEYIGFVVPSREETQRFVIKGLRTETRSIDPEIFECAELVEIDRRRIHLQGEFDVI
jgi:hypothetical protein